MTTKKIAKLTPAQTAALEVHRADDHPTFDSDGYPTDDTLRTIRRWPIGTPSVADCETLMDYIREAWKYADNGYWKQNGRRYSLSTAGWSGNESLVEALQANTIAWSILWQASKRGGHYVLQLPRSARAAKEAGK